MLQAGNALYDCNVWYPRDSDPMHYKHALLSILGHLYDRCWTMQEAYSLVEADTAAATEDTIPEDAEVQSAGCQYDPRVKEVLSKVLESSTTTAALITADLGKVQQAASVAQSAAASRSSIVLQPPQVGQLTAAQLVFAAVKALKIALDQPQYEAGFVLDNIRSRFLPHPAFAARCLLLAIGLENKALQQHEGLMEPSGHSSLSGSGTGAAAGKSKDKAPSAVAPKSSSRPSSSRSGRGALLEPPNPMLDFAKPDLWEGSQEVGVTAGHLWPAEPTCTWCIVAPCVVLDARCKATPA